MRRGGGIGASGLRYHRDLVGVLPDREVARRLSIREGAVRRFRAEHRIPAGWDGGSIPDVPPAEQGRARVITTGERLLSFDWLLGTLPDQHIAELAGVDVAAVGNRRRRLGKAAPPRSSRGPVTLERRKYRRWTHKLGRVPDAQVAERARCAVELVRRVREEFGIPPALGDAEIAVSPPSDPESPPVSTPKSGLGAFDHLLSVIPDRALALLARTTPGRVARRRRALGLPAGPPPPPGLPAHRRRTVLEPYLHLLGTRPDAELGALVGLGTSTVAEFRHRYGIPSARSTAAAARRAAREAPDPAPERRPTPPDASRSRIRAFGPPDGTTPPPRPRSAPEPKGSRAAPKRPPTRASAAPTRTGIDEAAGAGAPRTAYRVRPRDGEPAHGVIVFADDVADAVRRVQEALGDRALRSVERIGIEL